MWGCETASGSNWLPRPPSSPTHQLTNSLFHRHLEPRRADTVADAELDPHAVAARAREGVREADLAQRLRRGHSHLVGAHAEATVSRGVAAVAQGEGEGGGHRARAARVEVHVHLAVVAHHDGV